MFFVQDCEYKFIKCILAYNNEKGQRKCVSEVTKIRLTKSNSDLVSSSSLMAAHIYELVFYKGVQIRIKTLFWESENI